MGESSLIIFLLGSPALAGDKGKGKSKSVPPGWEQGEKKGWDGKDTPPGQTEKKQKAKMKGEQNKGKDKNKNEKAKHEAEVEKTKREAEIEKENKKKAETKKKKG